MRTNCTLCPRQCGAAKGFCGADDDLEVASVCIHRGEEPPLNPIVNVFFAHCNLQCIYCQNHQISGRGESSKVIGERYTVDTLADLIISNLSPLTSHLSPLLGLVTAAHYANHIPALLDRLHRRGLYPTVVYNSGGYESVETLRTLEGLVDVYLPDFKYMDPDLARSYSHAPDYPEVATAALREMMRQVGSGLKVDDDGHAYRGLIVRHLVLPGHVDNSLAVLDHLADLTDANIQAFNHSSHLHLSLMAQYYPPLPGLPAPLDRMLTPDEYAAVVSRAEALGLTAGWIQELDARNNYRPDFNQQNPFEK
jgi:putative pyruvate formate lyase activating enzyme